MAASVDAKKIIEHVGGKSNIKRVTHCTTRLRFNLVDNSKANKEELEALGILGVADMGTQYQVIVGLPLRVFIRRSSVFWANRLARAPWMMRPKSPCASLAF